MTSATPRANGFPTFASDNWAPVHPNVMRAIERVTADTALHTPDLGGKATTRMVTDAVSKGILADNE